MSQSNGLLPKLEIIIVGVLFLVFLIWSISKCSATRQTYAEQAAEEQAEQTRLDSMDKAQAKEAIKGLDTGMAPIKKPMPETGERVTPLYVITPALNLRTGPGLKFKVLERYSLHDELQFLGEVTDTTQKINLGEIVTDEPWIKVRSPKGTEGWVYGAGVDFYKRELKGVETE